MLEGLIEKLILSYFGDYIENLDKSKLNVGIWSGNLTLEDIVIRSKPINDLKLPFRLIFGRIGKLDIKIPWKSNFSAPTIINIETLQVVLSLLPQEEWEFLDFISYDAKIGYLTKFANERIQQLQEAFSSKENEKSSYSDRVILKILDNLHVNFKNINVRIEEPNKTPLYSMGITLEEMFVVNTNEHWEEKFIDRNKNKNMNVFKLLKIRNFGIYLNTNETYFMSTRNLSKSELQREMEEFYPMNTPCAKNIDYLIKPISLTAKMRQNNEKPDITTNSTNDLVSNSTDSTLLDIPRINLWISLEKFDIEIQKNQFDCIIRILNHISHYQRFQFNYFETRKFRAYKPKFKILDRDNKPNEIQSSEVKNENAFLWFKWGVNMVIKRLKFSRGKVDIYDLPALMMDSHQQKFESLFLKYLKNSTSLTPEEMLTFKEIIEIVEIQNLFVWAKPAIQEIYKSTKKQENKKAQTGFLKKLFGTAVNEADLLSKEEEEKIEEILENSVKEATSEVIKADNETKMQIDFHLNEGSFKFSKTYIKNNTSSVEGFGAKYKDLILSIKKGEYFTEINSELKEFNIEMFTSINSNVIIIPITFKTFQEEIRKNNLVRMNTVDSNLSHNKEEMNEPLFQEEDFVWKLNFRKNAPNSEINTKLFLQVNTLNIIYHQVLLERIIDFFKVDLNEDLANQAWDKIAEIKESTQESLKDAMTKRNVIEMKIEPRKVIVPINKYDLKNSKMLIIDIGKMQMYSAKGSDDKYPDRYNLEVSKLTLSHFNSFNDMRINRDRFDLITDTSALLGFAILNPSYSPHIYPDFKLFIDVNNITINTTEYLYTLLMYIIDVFKPAREADLWSQINQDKNEIKKNCKVFGKILKKNQLYRNWEEYYAVLSGGYIYFYLSIEAEDYTGYYYIKDCEILENADEPLILTLRNKYGLIEIKFQSETKRKQWNTHLRERITEMKTSYEVKYEEIVQKEEKMKLDENTIYFGLEANIKQANAFLWNECHEDGKVSYKKDFAIQIEDFSLMLNITDLDVYIGMSLKGLKVFDNLSTRGEFHQILDSTDPEDKDLKLVALEIFVVDERSPKYKNTQIEIHIQVGYLYALWHPLVIKRLLAYLAHNDILRTKVLREIQLPAEKLLEDKFIEPVKPEIHNKEICTKSKYTYIKLNTQLKKVRVVWIQPILNFMYIEMRLGESTLDLDMKVDHFVLLGELGNTQIFDLSNYPFTIRSQDDFNPYTIKEILGAKENTASLISFEYKSMNTWCPHCSDNYTSEADVKINSITLMYIQEHFLRFFNYLFGEFLGALGPSEEVRNFRDEKNQVAVKSDPKEIDLLRLKVVLNNPQAVLKPRAHFTEYFLVDFGTVTISCEYSKVYGRIRITPEEWRWNTTYHFDIKNFTIKTHDEFSLCEPSNGLLNMHFTYMTEEDKKMSDVEYDKSFQIDLIFTQLNLNMRQVDFQNIMKCNDLNILYTDEQYDDYNYERIYKVETEQDLIDKKVQQEVNQNNNQQSKEESSNKLGELLEKYLYMFVVLVVPKISVKFHLLEGPFSELALNDLQLNFYKKLSDKKEVNICVANMEGYHFVNETKKEIILSDFNQPVCEYQSEGYIDMMKDFYSSGQKSRRRNTAIINISFDRNEYPVLTPFGEVVYREMKNCKMQVARIQDSKHKQLDLKIVIEADREKSYMITLNGLKLIIGYTTLSLIKQFFMEGFPYYDKGDSDLPNLYDPNEETYPGMRVYLEIKNPLICLLSEDISCQEQDLLCLSSEIVIGYKKEKIAKIKTELYNNYTELTNLKLFIEDESQKEHLNNAIINDKSDVYTMTVSLFEVCPFISNMKDILFSELIVIPKRKIMDNFMLNYESKYHMQYIPPNNYIISYDANLDLNKMNIKASYRDIVLFLKSLEHHWQQMNGHYENRYNSLYNYSTRKKMCEDRRIALEENSKKKALTNRPSAVEKENMLIELDQYGIKKLDKSIGNVYGIGLDSSIMTVPFSVANQRIPEENEDSVDMNDCEEFTSVAETLKMNTNNISVKESAFQKFKPKDQIIDKGIGKTSIVSQGLQVILIDDHANTFYPFVSIVIQELNVTNEYLNYTQNILTANILTKVLIYNYIAGIWEPLIEKTPINVEVTTDNADEKVHSTTINVNFPVPSNKPYLALNFNISDMTVSFLFSTLKNWIDKYFKLKNNYAEEIKKITQLEKTMNISNHTVLNYTGRPLRLYKIYKNDKNTFSDNYKKLSDIAENQSYDIEYFDETKDMDLMGDVAQSLLKENYICFEMDGVKVNENVLRIDNIMSRTHAVNYTNLRKNIGLPQNGDFSKFDFIVSQIRFHNLRKFIYFYSPLSFKNKTNHMLIVSLVRRGLSNFFMFLEPKKTIGVPSEYMDGEIEFQFEETEPRTFPINKFLAGNSIIHEELKFKKACFSLFYFPSENTRNRVVTINNSYCIRNCLPFDLQVVLMKTKEVLSVPRGERVYTDSISPFENLTVSLFFLQFRTVKEVVLYNVKDQKNQHQMITFTVIDDKGYPLVLYASLVKGDTRTIVIHSKGVVINNTLQDVKFYYGKDTKKAIEMAGQKDIANVFLLTDEKYMILECNGFISQPFNITALGVSTVIECKKKKEKEKVIEFVMENKLSLLAVDLDIYSNVITFAPRFILYNQMNYPILICLSDNATQTELIRAYEKRAFYFFNRSPENMICIRLMEIGEKNYNSGSKWNWSEPISLLSDSLLTIQINGLNGYEKKFINLEKKLEGCSTFVIVTETTYDNCQFYIENYSSNVSCKVWQQKYEKNADFIDVRSKSIFAWSNYQESNILCVKFLIGSLSSRPLSICENDSRKYEIEDDRVVFIQENGKENLEKVYPASDFIYLKTGMYTGFSIKAQIITDGMRKAIKFTDIIHDVAMVTNHMTYLVELNVRIEKLGISLIGDNKNLEGKREKYKRNEIVYIALKDIMFYSKKQTVNEEIKSDMQMKIMDIELDNAFSYLSHFPIIMRPVNSNKFRKPQEVQTLPPFFNCAIFLQKKQNEEMTKILLLNYLVQSFYFSVDSNVIAALINFFVNLTKEMKTSLTVIDPVFVDNKINLENGIFIKENYFDPIWLQKTIIKGNSKLFIQRLETSPIEINLSLVTQSKDKVFQKLLQNNPILSSVLSTISNIEDVPILLNGSQMNNIYGDWHEIISNVLYIYQQSMIMQVMKLFGGIDILGNPLNLMHNLGRGVKDFFQKPMKGIVKGPLEGAKGVLDGSLSLVKHTVQGTFSSASKVTSGLSKGLLTLTQDDEYINDREKKKITEKPKNFVEGIGYGLSSMAGGIFYGVTDIVVKPIQGAKKDKWKGFGKGIVKGLAGVVAKPISGMLELVSKTTEGFKNSVNEDNKYKTERLPRPFYGKFKYIKSYNVYHAQVIEILNNRIDHFKSHSVDFYSSEIYKNQKGDNILVVFSTTSMYVIDVSRRELKSVLHYSEIKDVYLESPDKIRIIFNREINGKKNTSVSFYKENSSANQIFLRIKDAMENNYEERPTNQ